MCTCALESFLPQDLLGVAPNDLSGATYARFLPAGLQMPNQQALKQQETGPFNTSELNAPEYSTDEFRMFHFKVARCSKRYVHDWRSCPFAHPTENARRRDPRQVQYLPVPCPDYKRGICMAGDACPYSHGVYECWLHPAKYKTQLCKEGPHCSRPVCFFAHSVTDLRQPTHVFDGSDNENNATTGAKTVASALLQQAASMKDDHSSKRCSSSNEEEEAFNNMSTMRSSSNGGFSDSSENNDDRSSIKSKESQQSDDKQSDIVQEPSTDVPATPPAMSGERGAKLATTEDVPLIGLPAPQEQQKARPASLDLLQDGAQTMQPRMDSSDSTSARRSLDGSWTNGFTASAAAAHAMSGIPVNEQPMVPNQGPRMSNAVARKLGLAPSRTSSGTGILSPQRRSMDAGMPARRLSLDGSADGVDYCLGAGNGGTAVGDYSLPVSNAMGTDVVFKQGQCVPEMLGSALGNMWGGHSREVYDNGISSLVNSMANWAINNEQMAHSNQPQGRGSNDSLMGTFSAVGQVVSYSFDYADEMYFNLLMIFYSCSKIR